MCVLQAVQHREQFLRFTSRCPWRCSCSLTHLNSVYKSMGLSINGGGGSVYFHFWTSFRTLCTAVGVLLRPGNPARQEKTDQKDNVQLNAQLLCQYMLRRVWITQAHQAIIIFRFNFNNAKCSNQVNPKCLSWLCLRHTPLCSIMLNP